MKQRGGRALALVCFATILALRPAAQATAAGGLVNVAMTTFGPTASAPQPIVIDRSGSIWVGSFTTKAVSKISPNGTVVSITTKSPLENIAIGPDGKIYTAESGYLETIDPSSNAISTFYRYNRFLNPNYSAFTLAWDSAGNLYTASAAGQVTKILPNGTSSDFADASSFGTATVWGSLFAPNGNLIVLFSGDQNNPGGSAVVSITPSGAVTAYANISAYQDCIQGFFNSAGNLIVVCGVTNNVISIPPSGSPKLLAQFPGDPGLQFFARDKGENLFIAAYNLGIVAKVTPSGVISTFATLPRGAGPEAVAFDQNFNLYVSDIRLNAVHKITTANQ